MQRKKLKTSFAISILILWISGCASAPLYSLECQGELKVVGLNQEELDLLPRVKQFRIEWNDEMLKELCPETLKRLGGE